MCSSEELGLSGVDHKFWPVNKENEEALKSFENLYLCLDQSDWQIQGGLGSPTSSIINIDIIKCKGHDYCKPEEEIRGYFSTRYLNILSN